MTFPQLELPSLSSGWAGDEPEGVVTRAALYSAVYESRRADLAVYLGLAAAAPGPVLELGAGSGRLLAPLLAKGIDAYGLECDAESVAASRRRLEALGVPSERSLSGDMRDFDLGRRFASIFVVANTVSLLLEQADVDAMLSCVRRHLAPDGAFVFDVSRVEGFAWYAPPYVWRGEPEGVWVAGKAATSVERGSYDPVTRRCSVTREFELQDGRSAALHTLTHQRSIEDWIASLSRAGFEVARPIDERGGDIEPTSTLVFLRSGLA